VSLFLEFLPPYCFQGMDKSYCCIVHGPSGERIMDIVPGGTERELQLRRGVGQAAHTRNNPHVKCIGIY
jgi:hypothetical protein